MNSAEQVMLQFTLTTKTWLYILTSAHMLLAHSLCFKKSKLMYLLTFNDVIYLKDVFKQCSKVARKFGIDHSMIDAE